MSDGARPTDSTREPDAMGFGYEDGWIAYPRSLVPTRDEARRAYIDMTGADWIDVRVLSRWAVHDPQPYEPDWWSLCPKETPGAFKVWYCE